MLDSNQLRVFLAIIRTGNTLAAARRLGVDHSTVSRRLSALEAELSTRLFDRSPRGLAPTAAAAALIDHAERVEAELIAAAAGMAGREGGVVRGSVRLATPEVFGTWLVAPHLAELSERHPGLTLELAPESRSISLSKREADIAIVLQPPPRGRLLTRKLVDYRLGLYAARDYAARHGSIGQEGLPDHPFVSYIDELLDVPELDVLGQVEPGAKVVFRSSSSAAQQAAVAAGVGLGMLHRFAADRDHRLVRILPQAVEIRRSYHLVLHADQRRLPRICAVVDFLEELVGRLRSQL